MQRPNYIYTFIYDNYESELCKLESRSIFGKEESNKMLLSSQKIEPSSSAFIRKRLDVKLSSDNYETLIQEIKKEAICVDGFKVEYVVLEGDPTVYKKRLEKLKDIGYSIDGDPDYYNPTVTYGLCNYQGVWHFGVLIKNNFSWNEHKKKPFSYSNSININIAKALVNIASNADRSKKLLDACCGVGTIMLEACYAGYNIEGCDINWKVCRQSRENIAYFGYSANVYRSDIKDIAHNYDAAIIDLPYNVFSSADDSTFKYIIESAMQVAHRLVIVSITDITEIISNAGLELIDCCNVGKSGKVKFTRKIWVCNKE
ncbi:TRM11 family SAM-dependent methyltransferase [Carboxylicivirga linearis]|uniref:Methyltransferase n=1 Tax=Carboxylicivirga linearis TaxID=1628157 RepID=A0ABS5K0U1_9BACT|nr:methyltransferase [Carboxylicivirga linearis]MBS2100761.1 methyltransferase [Carboxylicivirga linearis]